MKLPHKPYEDELDRPAKRNDITMFTTFLFIIIMVIVIRRFDLDYSVAISSMKDMFMTVEYDNYTISLTDNITSSCEESYDLCVGYIDKNDDEHLKQLEIRMCDENRVRCIVSRIESYRDDYDVKKYAVKNFVDSNITNILNGNGDCKSMAFFTAAMLDIEGIESNFIVQRGHICNLIKITDSEYRTIGCFPDEPFLDVERITEINDTSGNNQKPYNSLDLSESIVGNNK